MRHIIPPSEYYLKTKKCICSAHRRKKKSHLFQKLVLLLLNIDIPCSVACWSGLCPS